MEDRASPGRVLRFCQKLAKDLGLKFDQWNLKCRRDTKDQRDTKILVADLVKGEVWRSKLGIEVIPCFGDRTGFEVAVQVGLLIETNTNGDRGLPLEFVINYDWCPSDSQTVTFDVFLSELAKDIQWFVKESPAITERIIKSKTFTDFSEASVLNWLGRFIEGVFHGMDAFVGEMGRSQDKDFALFPNFPENVLTEDDRRTLEESNLLPLIKQMLKALSSLAKFTPEQDRAHGEILHRCGFPKNDREITLLDRREKKLEKLLVNEIGRLLQRTKCKLNELRKFSTYIGTGICNGHFNHWNTKQYDGKRNKKNSEDALALVYRREATIE